MPDYRRAGWVLLAVAAATVVYVVAEERNYIRDFGVYQTAALRALAGEPLYRADDGFYQYKYWPVFAVAMAPFAFVPHELAKLLWFALSAGLIAWPIRLSIHLLPDEQIDQRQMAQGGFTLRKSGAMRDFVFMAAPCWRAFARG